MKTQIEKRQGRWVVLLKGVPVSNWLSRSDAETEAARLATKKPVGKMTWSDFKKAEGIDHIREDEQ